MNNHHTSQAYAMAMYNFIKSEDGKPNTGFASVEENILFFDFQAI